MWMDLAIALFALLPWMAGGRSSTPNAKPARPWAYSWIGLFLDWPRLVYSALAGSSSSASSPASSITGTLSSRALSSFEPASSPATT